MFFSVSIFLPLLASRAESVGLAEGSDPLVKQRFTEFILQSINESTTKQRKIALSMESARKLLDGAYSAIMSAKIVKEEGERKFRCDTNFKKKGINELEFIREAFLAKKEKARTNFEKFENGLRTLGKVSGEVRNQVMRLFLSFLVQMNAAVESRDGSNRAEEDSLLQAFLVAHICATEYDGLAEELSLFNGYQFGVKALMHLSNRTDLITLKARAQQSDVIKRHFEQLVVGSTNHFRANVPSLTWWSHISVFEENFGKKFLGKLYSTAIAERLIKETKNGNFKCDSSFNGDSSPLHLLRKIMVERDGSMGRLEEIAAEKGPQTRELNVQLHSLVFSFATRFAAILGEPTYLRAFAGAHGCLRSANGSVGIDSIFECQMGFDNRQQSPFDAPTRKICIICGESVHSSKRKANQKQFMALTELAKTPLAIQEALQFAGNDEPEKTLKRSWKWRRGLGRKESRRAKQMGPKL